MTLLFGDLLNAVVSPRIEFILEKSFINIVKRIGPSVDWLLKQIAIWFGHD